MKQGGVLKLGGTPSHHPFDFRIFHEINHPSSYWGTSMTLDPPNHPCWSCLTQGSPNHHPFYVRIFHCKPSSYWSTPIDGNLHSRDKSHLSRPRPPGRAWAEESLQRQIPGSEKFSLEKCLGEPVKALGGSVVSRNGGLT